MIDNHEKLEFNKLINEHRAELCAGVLKSLNEVFPDSKYDQSKCYRDLSLITDAIINDIFDDDTNHIARTAMAYAHHYNGMNFVRQRKQTLFAINQLRDNILELVINNHDLYHEVVAKFKIFYSIIAEKTLEQMKVWDYAARILPFVALALLSILYIFNWDAAYNVLINIVLLTFFTIAVGWWWWAIWKIASITITMRQAQQKFEEIKENITEAKKYFE